MRSLSSGSNRTPSQKTNFSVKIAYARAPASRARAFPLSIAAEILAHLSAQKIHGQHAKKSLRKYLRT